MRPLISASAPISQDGKNGWYHLSPLGEFGGTVDGKPVVQHIDGSSLDTVIANSQGKLLVDFEHRSQVDGGDTSAAAWISKLENRSDGLWGFFEFSDVGQSAVANKRYRHVSPVFGVTRTTAGKVVPQQLLSVGLTNRPNLKGLRPLSNKIATPPAVDAAHPAGTGEKGSMDYKAKLLEMLGLPDTADDAAIDAECTEHTAAKAKASESESALEAVANRAAALETELSTFKAAALDAEAESFCADHAEQITDRDATKALYIANKDTTVKAFALFKASASVVVPSVTINNRATAQTPSPADERDRTRTAFIEELVATGKAATYTNAWAIAPTIKPDLFG